MLLGGCITGGGHTGSGGRPWAAVAATPPPPSVMLSCCPAVRGGTWAGHNSCHLIVTPPYFSHGSPSSAFATSPPEPSLLPGTDNTAAAACRGRGAGGRAEALPVASCAGQHQHAASIARVAACSPQLIPSAPPPQFSPLAMALKLNGCKGDRRRERTDMHPCLHADSISPPQPVWSGQPKNPPWQGPSPDTAPPLYQGEERGSAGRKSTRSGHPTSLDGARGFLKCRSERSSCTGRWDTHQGGTDWGDAGASPGAGPWHP